MPFDMSRNPTSARLILGFLFLWLHFPGLVTCSLLAQAGREWETNNAFGVNAQRYGITRHIFVDNLDNWPAKSDTAALRAVLITNSAPASILWPGESAQVTLQIVNQTEQPLKAEARLHVIQYALTTSPPPNDPQDLFSVAIVKLGDAGVVPVSLDIPPKEFRDVVVTPPIPERFGGYALVLEIPGHERLWLGSIARSMKNPPLGASYRLCMDINNIPALQRLGAAPNRIGFAFRSPGDPDYEEYYQRQTKILRDFKAAGLPVIVEFGHDTPMHGKIQPLGRPRTFIQQREGRTFNPGKYIGDIAWLPQYDADFKAWVKRVALEFGWPKGPVNAIKLWNEPWEGISIACWGADIPRFREISIAMCEAVEEARKEGGVQVLLGGCDSTVNTLDKYFCDGKDDFLKWLDFVSIHYQALYPAAGIKQWVHRKGPDGKPSRVLVWDTESWCANSDDRIASALATMFAVGHDRVVGIHSQHVVSPECTIEVRTASGSQRRTITQAWSAAAAVGGFQHFIGNREFDRILWHGLPWVYQFKGQPGADGRPQPEDGTLVVVGDLAPVFGQNNLLLRNVRTAADVKAVQPLYERLKSLAFDSPERAELEQKLARRAFHRGGTLSFPADLRFVLFDYYGNPVPTEGERIVVPLDDHGYYLKADGRPGSFAALVKAVSEARIEGLQPVDFKCHDLLKTPARSAGARLRLEVVNILNRPVAGTLDVSLGSLRLHYDKRVRLAPHEIKTVEIAVEGDSEPANLYPLHCSFDAGKDGLALHAETMRANVIARRAIQVDGKLDDWTGVLPQTISSDGAITRTDAEIAWKPFEPFSATARKGLATAYLAHDDQYFYFAAKVADDTPDGGTLRFETRDDDAFFYPEKVWQTEKPGQDGPLVEATWPAGVRRYSYARNPYLPAGNNPNFDNLQIAFNAVPVDEKPWFPYPPGTFPGFAGYQCTDYEYALNEVAPQYGGGTEIWRLRHPKLPLKHFYPRQPKAPYEGPVKEGKLVSRREGNSRIVECAIPWSEIPHVKKLRDAGQPVRFTYRVNDSAGVGCLELAKGRSASKINCFAFLVRWTEHWANEVEFAFE
jgi:hypothetical protein